MVTAILVIVLLMSWAGWLRSVRAGNRRLRYRPDWRVMTTTDAGGAVRVYLAKAPAPHQERRLANALLGADWTTKEVRTPVGEPLRIDQDDFAERLMALREKAIESASLLGDAQSTNYPVRQR
jgi:hypothetical protein